MDLSRIFVKDANPTKMGGQAVMEGIMMKGAGKTAVAVRLPSGDIHIKTEENPKKSTWTKIPIVRGVIVFVNSLIQGTRTLMYSADVLEKYEEKLGDGATAEKGRFETWLEKHFGERAVWNILIAISVIISLVFSIGIFVIGPTAVINWMTAFTENEIVLNLTEGLLRAYIKDERYTQSISVSRSGAQMYSLLRKRQRADSRKLSGVLYASPKMRNQLSCVCTCNIAYSILISGLA